MECSSRGALAYYFESRYNIKTASVVADLEFEAVRESLAGVEDVIKDFPKLGKYLSRFDVDVSKENIMLNLGDGIYFHPPSYESYGALKAMVTRGAEELESPENTTIRGIGSHEAAHALTAMLSDRPDVFKRVIKGARVAGYCEAVVSGAYTRHEREGWTGWRDAAASISTYAASVPHECVAEAFCDVYVNGNKA
jgi:hypothetical protein